MVPSQSALAELLDAFRGADGVNLIRESVRLVLQEPVDLEATTDRAQERDMSAPTPARTNATGCGTQGYGGG